MKPYASYKDSGVEWLGAIPEHWEVERLKFSAPLCVSKLDARPEGMAYIGLENIESWTGRLLLQNQLENDEGAGVQFKVGEVLFGKLRPYLAKVARPQFDGLCTSELLVLRPVSYSGDYLPYSLLNQLYINWIDRFAYGTKMPRVSPDHVADSAHPLPPMVEQQAIAEYLDRETAKIDALVATKELLIELLQEKRVALISQTVTKGLDPNVPMKDSGVEWLGEIPAHWETKRLKHIATSNDDALPHRTDPAFELTYVDISSVDEVDGITNREVVTFGAAPSRARRIARDGDIIISTVRTYLRAIASIVNPETNLIVSTGFAVIRPRSIDSSFAAYVVRALYFVESVVANSVGVSYPAINANELVLLAVPCPSDEEQVAIANFLDRETAKTDALLAKVREAIERLNELRTALISAAVTGKIDLRESGTKSGKS